MEFTAENIAQIISGEVKGDSTARVSNFNGIENAGKGDLTYIDDSKYLPLLDTSNASIILLSTELFNEELQFSSTLILCENTRMCIAKLLTIYQKSQFVNEGISEHAIISNSSKIGGDPSISAGVIIDSNSTIGENAIIKQGCFIGKNVRIGHDVFLHAGVKIMDGSIIGNNVTIQANAVIGGDGFGFVPNSENDYFKIPHVGNVIVEDHVEIGSGTCIDRATMGSTLIKKGVKLDNLIQVAHNVEIGENTVIAAQTGIAGSAIIGKNCMIGGQVGIVGHIKIADDVKIAAQSGVGKSIKEQGSIFQGSPAFNFIDYKKSYVGFRKLPEILKSIHKLEKNANS